MIYFLQAGPGEAVKIGCSRNLEVRVKQLETLYGRSLNVLATMEGGIPEEREMHRRFAHLRFAKTEQFRPAPDLMDFIGRPLLVAANPDTVEAMDCRGPVTVLNLKGSIEQREWIESVSRKSGIPVSTIARRALHRWLTVNGHGGFPGEDE